MGSTVGAEVRGRGDGPPASADALRILVVDDESELRELVREYLERNGFVVATADGGQGMRQVLAAQAVDIVILDLKMPGEDGLSLARYLRSLGEFGIIMLTASVDSVDRIVGLEVGADDYIAKPFDLRELLARVRSLARRLNSPARTIEEPAGGRQVRFGTCVLNLEMQALRGASGDLIPLTSMEFALLKAFAERPNRVLSRDQLLSLAHDRDAEAFDRSIDVRILRLRRKIEINPEKPCILRTVRGSGYVFDPSGGSS